MISRHKLWVMIFIIAFASSLLTILTILSFLSVPPPESVNLEGIVVYAIGDRGTPLFEEFAEALEIRGAHVNYLDSLPNIAELTEDMFVLFDGEWIAERAEDNGLHAFLRDVAPRRVRLVAVGGETSRFFEALYEAGVMQIATDEETGELRNPAYFNPPLVGYRVMEKDGDIGDSILLCNYDGTDMNGLIEALVNWGFDRARPPPPAEDTL